MVGSGEYDDAVLIAVGEIDAAILSARFDDALRLADEALARFPQEPDLLVGRALALANKNHTRDATAIIDGVLALDPRHARALRVRGQLDMRAGRYTAAADHFHRSLDVAPHDPITLRSFVDVLIQLDEREEARFVAERTRRTVPDRAEGHLALLHTYLPAPQMMRRLWEPVLWPALGVLVAPWLVAAPAVLWAMMRLPRRDLSEIDEQARCAVERHPDDVSDVGWLAHRIGMALPSSISADPSLMTPAELFVENLRRWRAALWTISVVLLVAGAAAIVADPSALTGVAMALGAAATIGHLFDGERRLRSYRDLDGL